jgi:radical SAM protein with 4Fe4S-binding SPASM domain
MILSRSIAQTLRQYALGFPVIANLAVSKRCQGRCRMCSLWKTYPTEGPELTTDEVKGIVDDLVRGLKVPKIRISSLEPLLRPDIFEIISYIKSRGVTCFLLSNGMDIDRNKARELVSCGLDEIQISVDGVGAVHDDMRGVPGAFESLLQSIRNLKDARFAQGSTMPRLDAVTTITKYNFHQLGEIYGFVRATGFDYYEFRFTIEFPEEVYRATRYRGKIVASRQFVQEDYPMNPSEEQVRSIEPVIDEILKRERRTTLEAMLYPLSKVLNALCRDDSCLFEHHLYMDPDGNVTPCSFLNGVRFGNVRDTPVDRIWKGREHWVFLSYLRRHRFPVCRKICSSYLIHSAGSVKSQVRMRFEELLRNVHLLLNR